MSTENISRRTFIQNSSLAGAATLAGALARPASSATPSRRETQVDTSKILNYNPQMGYRRLGKTGLIISEVSLGGHWRAPWRDRSGGWWWGKCTNEQVPDDVAQNRTEVVSKAIECGMNYLDITGALDGL
jgi:hypothetical protein